MGRPEAAPADAPLASVPEDAHMGDNSPELRGAAAAATSPAAAGPSAGTPRGVPAPHSPSGSHGSSDKECAREGVDAGESKPLLELGTLCRLLDFCLAQAGSIGARLADSSRPPSTVCWAATAEASDAAASDQLLLQARCCVAALPPPLHCGPADPPRAQDLLQLIQGLLRSNASLVEQVVHGRDAEVMVRELLLHPRLPSLQAAVHGMLRAAILEGGAPHAQFWLLSVRRPPLP